MLRWIAASHIWLFGVFLLAADLAAAEIVEGDWIYQVEQGEAHIVSYSGSGGDVFIPSALGGFLVTQLPTFEGNGSLTSVHIPEGIKSIPDRAFAKCTSLTNIAIPLSVTNVGREAFALCTSLGSVSIPDGVTSAMDGTFRDCTALTNVALGNGIQSLSGTFWGCSSLASIVLPPGLQEVDLGAFALCTSLTSISIPKSVFTIGQWAFAGCRSLKSITFEGFWQQDVSIRIIRSLKSCES